jgi:hypothetical protein
MTINDKNEAAALNKGAGAVYWVRIFLSPFIAGLIVATIAFFWLRNAAGIVLAALAVLLGAFAGYLMAEKARKTIGTVAFAARTMTNTEFTDTDKKS